MIEKKQPIIFQVDVDIDLAKNPLIHEMYLDNKASQPVMMFMLENNIGIVDRRIDEAGRVTHISLRGSSKGLQNFVARFLASDESRPAYNLQFKNHAT